MQTSLWEMHTAIERHILTEKHKQSEFIENIVHLDETLMVTIAKVCEIEKIMQQI